VNVSKGGTSITVGKKGFHLNFGKHGVRQTTSLPGSGTSHTSYLYKDDDDEKQGAQTESRAALLTDFLGTLSQWAQQVGL
jgi:hypothetical protein